MKPETNEKFCINCKYFGDNLFDTYDKKYIRLRLCKKPIQIDWDNNYPILGYNPPEKVFMATKNRRSNCVDYEFIPDNEKSLKRKIVEYFCK